MKTTRGAGVCPPAPQSLVSCINALSPGRTAFVGSVNVPPSIGPQDGAGRSLTLYSRMSLCMTCATVLHGKIDLKVRTILETKARRCISCLQGPSEVRMIPRTVLKGCTARMPRDGVSSSPILNCGFPLNGRIWPTAT